MVVVWRKVIACTLDSGVGAAVNEKVNPTQTSAAAGRTERLPVRSYLFEVMGLMWQRE